MSYATVVVGTDGSDSALAAVDRAAALAVSDQALLIPRRGDRAPGVATMLIAGDPAHALLGVARERGADCIVVGSRGINRLSGRLLGSVPADVAYRSPCDVLIVHATEGVGE